MSAPRPTDQHTDGAPPASAQDAPVAFITGAAGGIGSALARRLAADGYRVALADVDPDRLDAIAGPLTAAGADVRVIPVDLSAPGAASRALGAVIDDWGRVDLVLPFAGVFVEPLAPVSPELRDLLRRVNLDHPLRCAERALAAAAGDRRRCTIVMPLSDAGLNYRDPWVYARAKAELHARTHQLIGAWRHDRSMHILRAVVYPTKTDFATNSDALLLSRLGRLPGDIVDHSGLERLMNRGARPDDVADAIVDAVDQRRRWLYLEPRGGWRRWRAWAKGEVLGPVVDRLPPSALRRLRLRARIDIVDPEAWESRSEVRFDEDRRSA